MQGAILRLGGRSGVAAAGGASLTAAAAARNVRARAGAASAREASHTEIHEIDGAGDDFELLSNSEIAEALHGLPGGSTDYETTVQNHESDGDSTVSFGAEADMQLEAPIMQIWVQGAIERTMNDPGVQRAVIAALRSDPDFAALLDARTGEEVDGLLPLFEPRWPMMLPAAAGVTYVDVEAEHKNPVQALLEHVGARLQGLGDRLAAAGSRVGRFLQSMGADLHRSMRRGQVAEGSAAGGAADPDHKRALLAGGVYKVVVALIVLALCRRASLRFATV